MNKHTPGPWFADRDGKVFRRDPRDLYENGGGVAGDHAVATVHRGWSSWSDGFPVEANARLIASAPDLLEALVRLKIEIVLSDIDPDYIESHFRPWLDKAAVAIAKARGEA